MKNNARLKPMNRCIIVTDIQSYPNKHCSSDHIWKGKILKDTEHEHTLGSEVFFSRFYDSENNEMDNILKEYYFKADENLLGVDFYIIPIEKVLFMFEPHSLIEKPPLTFGRKHDIRRQ